MGHLQQSAYCGSEFTEPSCFAVHSRVVVNSLLILQHLAGDILSTSISIYHVYSPKPAPLLPRHVKECPILHERATNRGSSSYYLPTFWSYFLRCSTCQLSVVSRGKTPLSGDKLTGTWQKNTRGEENPCCQDKWNKRAVAHSFVHFQSLAVSPQVS